MLQTVYIDEGQSRLFKGDDKMCLGANCGTGVWIMLQMIKAKVPGLYIFHRAEEIGGLGSGWIIDNPQASTDTDYEHWVEQYTQCIAFDRYGTKYIITHQGMERTCSDAYADALGELLGMGHKPDDGGSFTDSKNYCRLVPECTNLSVGYKRICTQQQGVSGLGLSVGMTDRLCTQSVTRSTSSHPRAILRRSSCSNTTTGVGLLIGATTMRTLVRPN